MGEFLPPSPGDFGGAKRHRLELAPQKKRVAKTATLFFAVRTRLELATSGVTGRHSNQTELPHLEFLRLEVVANIDIFLFGTKFFLSYLCNPMKLKKGYVLRELCGEFIVCPEGLDVIDGGRMFALNEPAAYLWRQVENTEFTPDTLLDLLLKEYDVSEDTARKDIKDLLEVLLEYEVVEE